MDTINGDKRIHSPVNMSKVVIRLHDVFTVALNGQIHPENRHLYIPKGSVG